MYIPDTAALLNLVYNQERLINRWKGMVDDSPPAPNSSDSHSQPSPLHNLNTVNQPVPINMVPMDQSLGMVRYQCNCRPR